MEPSRYVGKVQYEDDDIGTLTRDVITTRNFEVCKKELLSHIEKSDDVKGVRIRKKFDFKDGFMNVIFAIDCESVLKITAHRDPGCNEYDIICAVFNNIWF